MKLLVLDIETSPHLSFHWRRFKENIPPEFTVSESHVISWSAKWLGEKKVMFMSEWTHGRKTMLKGMYKLLNEADGVVHFNGKSFDIKRLSADFLRQGWGPPSPFDQVDLFLQTKRHFAFSSNRLKHLLKELGLTPKLEDNGDMSLWIGVYNKDKACQKRMEKYNKQDVLSTEELYYYMLGWLDLHPNWGLYVDDINVDKPTCPNCGDRVHKHKYRYTKVRKYIQYKCSGCGKYSRGRKNVGPKGVNNGVLV